MFTNRISKFFIFVLVVTAALSTVSFVTRSASLPQADRSYDAVEQLRVARPSVSSVSGYDQIEALRIQRGATLSTTFGYDAIEQVRLARAFSADRSYDNIEALRLWR